MNTKDLLELASLDAFGLLDEAERRAFEDGFARAHPAVRSQVRAAQRRMADLDALLPDVTPPASLRQRVLDAVAREVEIANTPGIAGHIGPDLIPSRGVSRIWRAAAIGCAAAAVVFGFTTLQMQSRYAELDGAIRANAVTELFAREFGPRFERALMAPRTQFIQFAADSNAPAGSAAAILVLDTEAKTGQLFCRDLPDANGTYHLTITDARGNKNQVALVFKASGSRAMETDIRGLELKAGESIQISRATADNAAPFLRSNNL